MSVFNFSWKSTADRPRLPLADRGPLRVMFMLTSMPVGGAEILLVHLIRGMDRARFVPELCCLKEKGPLGLVLAEEVPLHERLLTHKFDVRVLWRLRRLLRRRRVDAVVTVGCGDKMFWGRLAAWQAHVPVIVSALHSTGWPDGVGYCNRWLTPVTDAFIGVATSHGRHLIERERFPADKVFVVPNGVDTRQFAPAPAVRATVRKTWGWPADNPICINVAALRKEKNHERLLRVAARIVRQLPTARFVIVGDGPQRPQLTALAGTLKLHDHVRLLGTRDDVAALLPAADVFALTSDNEANPVSILEAMACGLPVVATNVGSIHESVRDGQSGLLTQRDDADAADKLLQVMRDPRLAHRLGTAGREHVTRYNSLQVMVAGYEKLLEQIYERKVTRTHLSRAGCWTVDSFAEQVGSLPSERD